MRFANVLLTIIMKQIGDDTDILLDSARETKMAHQLAVQAANAVGMGEDDLAALGSYHSANSSHGETERELQRTKQTQKKAKVELG